MLFRDNNLVSLGSNNVCIILVWRQKKIFKHCLKSILYIWICVNMCWIRRIVFKQCLNYYASNSSKHVVLWKWTIFDDFILSYYIIFISPNIHSILYIYIQNMSYMLLFLLRFLLQQTHIINLSNTNVITPNNSYIYICHK